MKTIIIFGALLIFSINSIQAQIWTEMAGTAHKALPYEKGITEMAADTSGNVYVLAANAYMSTQSPNPFFVNKWNGQNWTELPPDTRIRHIATDITGQLYGAGDTAPPYPANTKPFIGKWNGSSWTDIGLSGPPFLRSSGQITAAASDASGNTYFAGNVADSGRQFNSLFFVIKWNGSTWSVLDTTSTLINGVIQVMTFDTAGNLYAAGYLYDSYDTFYVAKWNGTAWSKLGTGASRLGANNNITVLTTDTSGNIYAAGLFTDPATSYPYVSKWNGSQWTRVGGHLGDNFDYGQIKALTVDHSGHLYAAGGFKENYNSRFCPVKRWDGVNWAEPDSGAGGLRTNAAINTMMTTRSGTILLAGAFENTFNHNYVATWDGTQMGDVSPGSDDINADNNLRAVVRDSAGNVYVMTYNSLGPVLSRWNGTKWDALGTGHRAMIETITDVALDAAGSLYVVGNFPDSSYGYQLACVAKWDGNTWSRVGNRNFHNITKLIIDKQDNVYIAQDSNVYKWDGNAWSVLGALHAHNTITALATDIYGDVYAGGLFTDASNYYYIAKWDGSTWSHLAHMDTAATGVGVTTIVADASGYVYANGENLAYYYYGYHGGQTWLSKWDGNAWSHLGNRFLQGDPAPIYVYKDDADNIYVGGMLMDSLNLTQNGYINTTYHAMWTGSEWKKTYDLPMNHSYDQYPIVTSSGDWYASISYVGSGHYYRRASMYHYTPACSAPVQQDLCIVTIDSASNKPVVVWNKSDKYATAEYSIYRAATPGTAYTEIAAISRDSLSEWMDTAAHPELMSYRYRIAVRDTCAMKDAQSAYHQTIYLTYAGNGQFTWTPYVIENGQNPTSAYDLYRDSIGNGNWQLIASAPNTQTTATAPNYNAYPNAQYKVVATLATPCTPSRDVSVVASNTITHITLMTGINDQDVNHLSVTPNPSMGYFNIAAPNGDKSISVTDMIGQSVYQGQSANSTILLDATSWTKGIYTCEIHIGNAVYRVRIVRD